MEWVKNLTFRWGIKRRMQWLCAVTAHHRVAADLAPEIACSPACMITASAALCPKPLQTVTNYLR